MTHEELAHLRSQIVTTNVSNKSRSLPSAFTEHGTLALSSVLNSRPAIEINRKIIKVFVELRTQVSDQPEYALLLERVRRIEAEQESLCMNQMVDSKLLTNQMTKLGRQVRKMSDILDQFQDNYLIVKRPNEDLIG